MPTMLSSYCAAQMDAAYYVCGKRCRSEKTNVHSQ